MLRQIWEADLNSTRLEEEVSGIMPEALRHQLSSSTNPRSEVTLHIDGEVTLHIDGGAGIVEFRI